MNQIDCKQAQNVWSRVMAAQAGAQSTSANPPVQGKAAQVEQPASITPEQLLSSIEYEMLDAVTYQCLAARMSGCAQKTLRALSQDERRHAKELSAMYFLLTGKKVCPKKPDSPCITCNAETLRRQYQGELAARDHYEALEHTASECIGCHACESRCPFGVPIAERMQKTTELFGR